MWTKGGDTGKKDKHNRDVCEEEQLNKWDALEVEGHDFRPSMGLDTPEIAPECPWTRCPKLLLSLAVTITMVLSFVLFKSIRHCNFGGVAKFQTNPTIISSWLYTSSYSIFFHCNTYIYILFYLYCIYSLSIWYIYSVSENVSPQTQHKSHWYGKPNAMFTIPIPSPFFWGGGETIPKW